MTIQLATVAVAEFDPATHSSAQIAAAHLAVRRQQETDGQNIFPDIYDSQADLITPQDYYIRPGGNFWVTTIDGELAGFVSLRNLGGGEGEVKRMATVPTYRRRGIARAMLTQLILWAQSHGYEWLTLRTGAGENTWDLYHAVGFRVIDYLAEDQDWYMGLELAEQR